MTPAPQQKLRPKRWAFGVGGLSLFATGGCLMWTIVLIPLALPLAVVGLVMACVAPLIKVETLTCPACHETDRVEPSVNVVQCPACQRTIQRTADGWDVLP